MVGVQHLAEAWERQIKTIRDYQAEVATFRRKLTADELAAEKELKW